jgi:hypothetical protein
MNAFLFRKSEIWVTTIEIQIWLTVGYKKCRWMYTSEIWRAVVSERNFVRLYRIEMNTISIRYPELAASNRAIQIENSHQ